MSGRVPEHVVQQIARSADIVRLIGRHCDLKQRGKSLWALCPFHKEKTASFKVDPESGLYYCFGCKEAGNVFTFLRKVEGLEFYEALERLARDAGVDLSQYRTEGGPSRSELDRLRELSELATSYYAKCLQKAKGAPQARQYLKERKISGESVQRWRLGYAPPGWEHFLEVARNRGYEPRVLELAGLVVPRTGGEGYYDRFRDRLMFPITDRGGRSIGFGARALGEDDQVKYLNSPEGPLFSKGRCFYGFCEARDAIRTDKTAVIVEGYTDVIMAHQFGVESVMAVLGTALTEDHARSLRTLCERVILVFDADEAGQASATRSTEVLLGEDLDVRVATLEPGEDPCDFLLARGPDEFRARLEASEDFLAFRLRRARQVHDTSTVTGRARAFDDLAELAIKVRNEARRDMLIRSLAEEFALGIQSAMARVGRLWSQASRGTEYTPRPSEQDSGVRPAGRAVLLELTGLLLNNAGLQAQANENRSTFSAEDCPEKHLLEQLLARFRDEGPVEAGDFVNGLDDPDRIALASAAIQEDKQRQGPISLSPIERYRGYRRYFEGRELQRQKEELLTTAAGAPTTTTATQAPTGEDERLRAYEELRRRQDKRSASINPRKGG